MSFPPLKPNVPVSGQARRLRAGQRFLVTAAVRLNFVSFAGVSPGLPLASGAGT